MGNFGLDSVTQAAYRVVHQAQLNAQFTNSVYCLLRS